MKRKRISVLFASILGVTVLIGCGNTAIEKTEEGQVLETETAMEIETKIEVYETEILEENEVINPRPENGEASLELEETTVIEENSIQMIDWETWVTNTDQEEVCLAIYNEITGVYTFLENGIEGVKYDMQEGDRFTIAHRENIEYVSVNGQQITPIETESGSYYEIVPEGERTHINVLIDDNGYDYSLSYKIYIR